MDNMSLPDGTEGAATKTDGPFGFGYAYSVDSKLEQCLKHTNFGDSLTDVDAKDCSMNPADCTENGFSISVWEKAVFDESIFEEDLYDNTKTDKNPDTKYVLSTGGDNEGHPGVAIYHSGLHLVAVVSTGDDYWELKVMGPMRNNTWNNIGLRWESTLVENGGKGLELYVNLEMVGQVMESKKPEPAPSTLDPVPSALKIPEMMLGCHKTSTNTTYGGYNDAAYDELALWTRRLNDTDKWYFLGGYQEDFADISTDEFQNMLDRVDLEDPAQQAAAVNILSQMTNPETSPSPSPTSATINEPSPSSKKDDTEKEVGELNPTVTPTEKAVVKAPVVNKEKLDNLAKMSDIMNVMTDVKKVKKDITEDELKTYMKLVDVASNILSSGSAGEWVGLLEEEDNPGASKTTTRLEQWTMQLISNTHYDNESQKIEYIKDTDNLIMRVNKMEVRDLEEIKFYETPVYSKDMKDKWSEPRDKVAVPTGMFKNDTCKDRPVSIMSTIYNSYGEFAPTVVSPATLNPTSINDLDSRIISVQIRIDPNDTYQMSQEKDPCFPDPDYLRENPTRILLDHKLKMISLRKLQFHENEIVTEVKKRYCVWWNPSLSDFGAWDAKGCRILETKEDYTKCACDHLGTFAIMAEKIDPIEVPEEATWLSITKYVGYGVSMLFLMLYILVIAFSGDLKEQFHLMGLNLAVAVLLGSVFMIISDFTHDDRHTCTAIGSLIHFFYLAAGAWMALLGHASFKAITSGIIGGRLKAYCFIAWGLALISLGVSYIFFLHDLGTDPRCFISWNNNAKYVFFAPQMLYVAISLFFGMIVLCNMSTPALRKDNLIDDYGSFCRGASFLMVFFGITWSFGLVAYVRFGFKEPDFFPIFQVLNSWTGVLIFLFIGICSNRFRMILAGQSKLRKEMLFNAALGRNHKSNDKEHLNTPEDQNTRASSAGSSPTQSRPSTASTGAPDIPSRPASKISLVAGRPGSSTLS